MNEVTERQAKSRINSMSPRDVKKLEGWLKGVPQCALDVLPDIHKLCGMVHEKYIYNRLVGRNDE